MQSTIQQASRAPNSNSGHSQSDDGACSSFETCISENPGTALMLSGLIGLGAGIAIGVMLGAKHKPEPIGWFDTRTAEKIGQQVLAGMSKLVPESVSSRFHS